MWLVQLVHFFFSFFLFAGTRRSETFISQGCVRDRDVTPLEAPPAFTLPARLCQTLSLPASLFALVEFFFQLYWHPVGPSIYSATISRWILAKLPSEFTLSLQASPPTWTFFFLIIFHVKSETCLDGLIKFIHFSYKQQIILLVRLHI